MSDILRQQAVEAATSHIALLAPVCRECGGYGQGEGDGSGWDGTTMHTPACKRCNGEGIERLTCNNWRDSCHGDPEIDECVCARHIDDALAAAEPFIRAQVVAEIAALLRSDRVAARIGYERAQRIAELVESEFGGTP